jgi:ribose-phosphate pyrophosphokinase
VLIAGFADYDAPARALAGALRCDYGTVCVHHFPDGESGVRLPLPLPKHLVVCRSLDHPNDKLIELLLAITQARQQGAAHITLVAPYLCYLRQDKAFTPGEAVSARIIGTFLASLFDAVITVDPHLHRLTSLHEAIPTRQAISLSAAAAMAEFLATEVANPLLLGPDAESAQWVATIAAAQGWNHAVAEKRRLSDRELQLTLPDIALRDRNVVLVDDVISTGHTLRKAAQLCLGAGASSVSCMVTHGLFAEDAEQALRRAGVRNIWSSDSITHASNVIALAPLLAAAVRAVHGT